jgi:hypothetical protein
VASARGLRCAGPPQRMHMQPPDRGRLRPDESRAWSGPVRRADAASGRRRRSVDGRAACPDDARERGQEVHDRSTVIDDSRTGTRLPSADGRRRHSCPGEVLTCADRSTRSTMADQPVRQTGRRLHRRRGHRPFRCRRTESRERSTAAERGAGDWHTSNPGGRRPARNDFVASASVSCLEAQPGRRP